MTDVALNAASLFVSLTCKDLERSIKFYQEGLGCEIVDRGEQEGRLTFVMMKAGNAMIGLGQDDFAKGRDRTKAVGLRIWITTAQDLVALAARATASGITLDDGPAPLPWGPMAFALTDPDGFKYTVTTPR